MARGRINGVELYWALHGAAGDPLVLVHGSWGDHVGWNAIVPALARSFRVLTYDRRGHSQSERPATQGSIHEDVSDLAALIDHLDLAPAHILGNSFGGCIVLRLAATRPDLFRSLMLHEPPLFGLIDDGAAQDVLRSFEERSRAVVALLEAGHMEAGARQFAETIAVGPGTWAHLPVATRQTMIVNAPTFLDEARDPDALTMDIGALSGFSKPVLLTQGEHSEPFFPPVLDELVRALPRAQRQTLARTGHIPHASHPQAYVEAVVDFLSTIAD